jgi:hypothetical protein
MVCRTLLPKDYWLMVPMVWWRTKILPRCTCNLFLSRKSKNLRWKKLLVMIILLQMTILVMLLICLFFFIPSVKSYGFLMLVEQWPITNSRPSVTCKKPLPQMWPLMYGKHPWKWCFASNQRPIVGYWPLFN